MNKLLLLVAGLLLAIGAVFVFTWQGHTATEVDSASETVADAGGHTTGTALDASTTNASPHEGDARREQIATATSKPATEAGARVEGPTVKVRVLARETKKPVADAEVGFAVWDDMRDQDLWRDGQWDAEKFVAARGKIFKSDAQGEVLLPKVKRQAAVNARKDELYGEAWFNSGEPPSTIWVDRDLNVRVRVTGPSGDPLVGFKVGARASGNKDQGWWEGRTTRSEANGIATFKHFQTFVGERQRMGNEQQARWVAFAAAPGVQSETETFDPRDPPKDPLALLVPATGSVVVQLMDLEGKPCQEQGWVQLMGADRRRPSMEFPKLGIARFAHVGLGASLKATGYVGETECDPKDFAGPATAGQEVTVSLTLSRTQPVLVGIALDANKQPIANKELQAIMATDKNGTDQLNSKTDATGRFRVLPSKDKVGTKITRLTLMVGREGGDRSEAGVFARVEVPRMLAAGVEQLGELVFADGPLIVGGIVVDETGAGIGDAELQLMRRTVGDKGKENREPLHLWNVDIATRAFEDGRFEVRGFVDEREHVLHVHHRDHVRQEPQRFARGQKDLRVVLTRGGSMLAKTLVDADLTARELRLSVRQLGIPDAKEIQGQNNQERASGAIPFSWRGLPAGSWELLVRVWPEKDPLRTLPNLEVKPGGACDDPRLAEIDLRGIARRIELTVVDAAGKVVEKGGSVRFGTNEVSQLRQGKTKVWLARSAIDATVVAAGFKKKSVSGIAGDTTITLEGGYAVRVKVENLPELPAKARAMLRLGGDAGGGGFPLDFGQMRFDPESLPPEFYSRQGASDSNTGTQVGKTNEFTFMLSEAGEQKVSFTLRNQNGMPTAFKSVEPKTLLIKDVAGEQSFVIALDKAEMDKALQAQRK